MALYYYKTSEASATGKALAAFWSACRKAEKRAEVYARRMGAVEFFFSPQAFTGGVEWLVFENPDKVDVERWKEGEPIDGVRVWKPNVTTIVHQGEQGKVYTTYDSPYKAAKTKFIMGKRTKYRRSTHPGKYSRAFLAAVKAEKDRMELPVIGVEKLCELLRLRRIRLDEQQEKEKRKAETLMAPTFFAYKGEYYISSDYPSESSDLELINFEKFRFNRNMALNDIKIKERLQKENEDL